MKKYYKYRGRFIALQEHPDCDPVKVKADDRLARTAGSPSSLTPETDAAWAKHRGTTPDCWLEFVNLASNLERRLAEARRIAECHRDAAKNGEIYCPYHTWTLPWESPENA